MEEEEEGEEEPEENSAAVMNRPAARTKETPAVNFSGVLAF